LKFVPIDTKTVNTTGLVLEVTMALELSGDDNSQTNILSKVITDTERTKT
jgi:hypothetical protein